MRNAVLIIIILIIPTVLFADFKPRWFETYGWNYEGTKNNYKTFKGTGSAYEFAKVKAIDEMKKISGNAEIVDEEQKIQDRIVEVYILAKFPKIKEHQKSKFSEIKKVASEKIACGFRSIILPGYGQYHNKRYSKAVMFFTATLAGGYMIYDTNKKASALTDDKNKLFVQYNASSDLNERNSLRLQMNTLTEEINSKQKQRDTFIIGTGVVYALNVIDAFVFSKPINRYDISKIRINDNTDIQITSRNIRLNFNF
ncbi:MAG TPA: DUF5683 domain-containing protein [bacterium]|nr:DUF5683 domain-containing protein [bacterium]